MDRISKLPIGIIETILCFLPIQDAARTSILSKEWRYHWIKIPKLAFVEDTFEASIDWDEMSILEQMFKQPSNKKLMTKRDKLFYTIYQVLLTHEGSIHEFNLSMRADETCVEIDHIILHLLKKNTVTMLKLDFFGSYTLPLSFFSFHHLTDLYISNCSLDHQPTSNVFGSLTTLTLDDVQISKNVLIRLLSGCPLLKRLALMSDGGTIDDRGDSTIGDLSGCLQDIEYLSLMFFIFTIFLPLPKTLPTKSAHLKYLSMEWVWVCHKYALHFLFLLIRSFPNLEKLKLELCVDILFDESWRGTCILKDLTDVKLENLKELEILQFSDQDNELDIVKFLLGKSPVLKNVTITLWDEFDEDEKLQISKTILSFVCASPVVKISIS